MILFQASHQIVKRVRSNETTSTQEDGNAEFSEETRSENDNSVEDENAQFTSVVQVNFVFVSPEFSVDRIVPSYLHLFLPHLCILLYSSA